MADTITPELGLTKPEVGVVDLTKEWGEKLNENFDKLDTAVIIIKDTYNEIAALTKVEGQLYYAKDNKTWYGWDGTDLIVK